MALTKVTMEFGASLRKARIKKKKTLRRLAEDLGFSAAYVSDIENGRRAPFTDRDVYARIVDAVGGTEEKWNAMASADHVRLVLAGFHGVPEHVCKLVCDIVTISPVLDEKRVRDIYGVASGATSADV